VWYDDGKATAGSSRDLDNIRTAFTFTPAAGQAPDDILAMAIASDDTVFSWYRNSQVAAGSSSDLDADRALRNFSTPPGYDARQLVAVGIAKSNDRVYAYWDDGGTLMVSIGNSTNLDRYREPRVVTIPGDRGARSVIAVGIAGDDTVFAWWNDDQLMTSGDSGGGCFQRDAAGDLTLIGVHSSSTKTNGLPLVDTQTSISAIRGWIIAND
jgi:hypothetical protein